MNFLLLLLVSLIGSPQSEVKFYIISTKELEIATREVVKYYNVVCNKEYIKYYNDSYNTPKDLNVIVGFSKKMKCKGEAVIGCRHKPVGSSIHYIQVNSNYSFTKNLKYQYCLIKHELGHAIGLKHSGNKNSIMYYEIDPKCLKQRMFLDKLDIEKACYLLKK